MADLSPLSLDPFPRGGSQSGEMRGDLLRSTLREALLVLHGVVMAASGPIHNHLSIGHYGTYPFFYYRENLASV
jgi:hypothetical protein